MMTKTTIFTLAALTFLGAIRAEAGVRLSALQIISTDAAGIIPGVGGHRFKTTQHGGQPCIFVVKGDNIDGTIINGPGPDQNGIDIPLGAGTYTYTIYAEKYNSWSWNYYTLNLYFDQSTMPQISALAPLNVNSTEFFPPFSVNPGRSEDLMGHPIESPKSLVYKSGDVEVTVTAFQFSNPPLYGKDRVSPFEVKSNNTFDYVGQFTLEVKAPPEIFAGGVVNGASFGAKTAPGSLFSVFGGGLATAELHAASVPLPYTLGGTSVTVDGKDAPLVFVSPGQINAQIPYEVTSGAAVPVVVTVNGVASNAGMVTVVAAAPGVFQFGEKRAVVQNSDYSLNNVDNGAAPGSYVIAYLTGSGQVDNVVPTGHPAKADPLSHPTGAVTATINGTAAEVAFAGLTPDLIGLLQVNLKIPDLQPGSYPLVVTIDGEKSNSAMISVK